MSKQPPPAHAASAVGPCPTVIQIVGRPGTGSLPDLPPLLWEGKVRTRLEPRFAIRADGAKPLNRLPLPYCGKRKAAMMHSLCSIDVCCIRTLFGVVEWCDGAG